MNLGEFPGMAMKKISQVASEVAGSDYYKRVFPGLEELQRETGEKFSQKIAGGVQFDTANVDKVKQHLSSMILGNAEGAEVEKIRNDIGSMIKDSPEEAMDAIFNKYAEQMKQMRNTLTDDKLEEVKQMMSKTLREGMTQTEKMSPEEAYKSMGLLDKMKTMPQAYFTNPDKKTANARIATAAMAYVGLNVGGRYLSGGTLTTDNYGRRDIAGIPFI